MSATPTTWTRLWRTVTFLTLVLGVAAATTVLDWHFTVTLVVTMAFIGGTYGALWAEAFPRTRRPVLTGIVVGPACSLGLIGVIHTLGPAGGLLLLVLGLTSPWVLGPVASRLGGRRRPRRPRVLPQDAHGTVLADQIATLASDALARAWADTDRDLHATHSTRRWQAIAEARSLLLDEVERRDPDAFAAWLSSGPDAASFPRLSDRPSTAND